MKGDTEVILMIIFFFCGAVFAVYAEELSILPFVNTIIAPLATLLAAFFGAKFAFQLQTEKQEKDRIYDEVKYGNKAIFEIIRTYNKFVSIRNQFIDPQRNNPLRHYFILPITGVDAHVTNIDFDSLAFLINTKDPDILNKLSAFQQEANSTIEVINQRSKMHFDVIQHAVEIAEKTHGSRLSEQQIDAEVGNRYKTVIKSSTDIMVECVDSVIALSEEHVKNLSELLKSTYKGHTIIKMEIPNESSNLTGAHNAQSS